MSFVLVKFLRQKNSQTKPKEVQNDAIPATPATPPRTPRFESGVSWLACCLAVEL